MKIRVDTIISRKRHICNVSLYLDEFVIHEIKVIYGRKGIYLIFPNMTYPINEETRQKALNLIIRKLKTYPEFIRLHSDKIWDKSHIIIYSKEKDFKRYIQILK